MFRQFHAGALACAFFLASLLASVQSAAATTIGLSFTGLTLAQETNLTGVGYTPPDNAGAVGPTQIAQLINGAYSVYDKSNGQRTQIMSDQTFWSNAGLNTGPGTFNARIIYDPTTSRWFAAELTGENTGNNLLVARSDTSDPTGGWKAVAIPGTPAGNPAQFADFTMLGLNADGIYVTTNNYSSRTGSPADRGISVFSIPKVDLLAATPTATNLTRFDVPNYTTMGVSVQPIVNFGPSTGREPLLGTINTDPASVLYRSNLMNTTGPGATKSSAVHIAVDQYDHPPKAGQPAANPVSTIDDRFTGQVYQVGNFIYASHAVITADGFAGVEWYKINESTNQVVQQGVFSELGVNYFQPSINANAKGDIVIAFTRSGEEEGDNISNYVVVGHTSAGVVTFDPPILVQAGTVDNYHTVNDRWGDYTSTIVDPSNPNRFWLFQQFAVDSTSWGTQITEIIVPEPGSLALAGMGLAALAVAAWRRRPVGV